MKETPERIHDIRLITLHALALYKQKKFLECIDILKIGFQENKTSLEISICLANCLCAFGFYSDAIPLFIHCQTLGFFHYATNLEAKKQIKIASIQSYLGRNINTTLELKKIKHTNMLSLNESLQIASLLIEAKNYRLASVHLENLIDAHPLSVHGYKLLGLAYYSQQELAKAKKSWEKALEIHPEDTDLKLLLDRIL